MTTKSSPIETATLAGGCFWCTEAIFQRLKGVISVMSGYSGGVLGDPSYEEVSYGHTGHAEAVQIQFDPSEISYEQLLEVFWHLHDPTTLNQQGADTGEQYRSVVFYHSDEQKKIAERSKKQVDESGMYKNQVVTEIVPYTAFYEAEEEHRDFYNRNPNQGYCRVVIDPKIQKLYKEFGDKVKK